MNSNLRTLGPAESRVVLSLREQGRSVVRAADVLALLGSENSARKVIRNLLRKGWLARTKDGKAYRYTATASREEYSARLMQEALAVGGDTEVVLTHFIAQIGGAESEALRTVMQRLTGRRACSHIAPSRWTATCG